MRTRDRILVVLAATAASLAIGLAASAQNLDVKGTHTTEGNAFFYQSVGIGTTTPGDKLTVAGSIQLATGNYDRFGAAGENTDEYHLVRVNPAYNTSSLRLYLHDDPDESFAIWGNSCAGGGCGNDANAQEAHRFRADGNAYLAHNGGSIGIGTTSPAQKLHVANASAVFQNNGSFLYGMDGGGNYRYAINNDGSNLNFYGNDGSWFNYMTVVNSGGHAVSFNSGNVGFGRSDPRAKVDIWGGQLFVTGPDINGTAILAASGGNVYLGDNSLTNGISITPSGAVGVGTTSPQAQLQVNGNLRIGGTIELLEKTGDNGTASCAQFCIGSQWWGWSGTCVAAFDSDTGGPTSCSAYNGTSGLTCLCARFGSGVVTVAPSGGSGGSCPGGYSNCGGSCIKSGMQCP